MLLFERSGDASRRGFQMYVLTAVIAALVVVTAAGCRRQARDSGLLPGTHTLVLPDGTQLTSADATDVHYRDISIRLEVIGIDTTGEPALQATGNHREVKSVESVAVGPSQTAWLALVERSGPAASESSATTREYWLIAVGPDPARNDMRLAYSVVATVTGNETSAREELLECAKGWTLPGKK